METGLIVGPPRLLERAVRPFIPPMVREEISGDLWERFKSPVGYVADAAAILPFVVLSQARRATNGSLFALWAFTVFASFGGFEPTLAPVGVTMWQRALVATLPALAALLLRNAYRRSDAWTARRAAGDLLAMLLAVLAAQGLVMLLAQRGLIDPYWRLSPGFLIGGLLFSATIVLVLRAGFDLAPRPSRPPAQSHDALAADYRQFRRNLRFRHRAEIAALCLLLVLMVLFGFKAEIPLVRYVALAWVVLALPATAFLLLRSPVPSPPDAADPSVRLAIYRHELARQRGSIGLVWWLCFGPLFAGLSLNMIVRGLMNGWFGLAAGGLLSIAALAAMIARADRARRCQLAEKIAALERMPAG